VAYILVREKKFPEAAVYYGPAEVATAVYRVPLPEWLPRLTWIRDRLVSSFETKLREAGVVPLELRVWEDTAPTLHTLYKVEVTAHESPIVWTPILLGIIALLGLAGMKLVLHEVRRIVYGMPPEARRLLAEWPKWLSLGAAAIAAVLVLRELLGGERWPRR